MRVEYKNPEILKRPDTRIILKDIQGIWEESTKTLRIYYEGIILNLPTLIVSTDGDEILELILEDEDTSLGNCGNIIYIEFPEDTKAYISTTETPSNITYLESRGYAIGENILRGIDTEKIKKFVSKSSWYRYFRINRLTKESNIRRLDWAGRNILRDYYRRNYSNLQLFCNGIEEGTDVFYDFMMSTPCITFYGFATEETWKVEGNSEELVFRELVSLENIPGLTITELPGNTQNFVISVDSEHLQATLLTIPEFDPETTETIYSAEFIAEVYNSDGQRNTSNLIKITTASEKLDWDWDRERTTTMFIEGESPIFLFRYNDCNREDFYNILRIRTSHIIENVEDITITWPDEEQPEDMYFSYEVSLDTNSDGYSDIVIKIRPKELNLTDSWVPRLYSDIPEPREVNYKKHSLEFFAVIGPKNPDLLVVLEGDEDETDINYLELPDDGYLSSFLVKSTGDDTYWRGLPTHSNVYATNWGYTGLIEKTETTTTDTTVSTSRNGDNSPRVVDTNTTNEPTVIFDIPDSDTTGKTKGLWIFPASCCVHTGQEFYITTAEVKGSSNIWLKSKHLGPAQVQTSKTNSATQGGRNGSGSTRSYTSRDLTSGGTTSSGTVTRNSSTSSGQPDLVSTYSSDIYGCFYTTRWKAPDTPGEYEIKVYGTQDQTKVGYCKVKVLSPTLEDQTWLNGAGIIAFRKENEYSPSADMDERNAYHIGSCSIRIYSHTTSNPNNLLVVNFADPNCDLDYKITKSGIIDHIEKTQMGLKIFCGDVYGATCLIIYSKSDPSIFTAIPVVLFGGNYSNYIYT